MLILYTENHQLQTIIKQQQQQQQQQFYLPHKLTYMQINYSNR